MTEEGVLKINMNFYVRINNIEHKLVQGLTISEEYNETLDSGNIIISNSLQLDLNPYDDVFIYGEWCGEYHNENGKMVLKPNYNKKFVFKGYPVDNSNYLPDELPFFYKHFLLDQFTEEIIILGDSYENTRYKYTIDLFSETKGLEVIQAPNISVTQPLKDKINSVDLIENYVELYNRKINIASEYDEDGNVSKWRRKNKYSIATNNKINWKYNGSTVSIENDLLEPIPDEFSKSYCPDFTLNSPNLRQILEKFLIAKDRIPVVKDDKIYAIDITKRREKFDLKKGEINYITGSKSSDNYCTDLKRTYNDGLAQEHSGRYTEYLGFRNCDEALLTLDNMRVETKFPIYKISKFYMCYYKKIKIKLSEERILTKAFLCKQDITPLIKLNSERNVLSEDIDDFLSYTLNDDIEKISKFKLSTLGYDIGSKTINGWGQKYSFPESFFWQNENRTYIESIFKYMNGKYPFGIYDSTYILEEAIGENYQDYYKGVINVSSDYGNPEDVMIIPDYGDVNSTNIALHLKHLFFQIEYQPFYNGTVIHSKGIGKEGIIINDNPSSSLTLLESDGVAQMEKLNRYGNKGIQINVRYTDINELQMLGSIYENNNDEDIIIYHKQYSINDNVINCTYYGSKDYVLKNYFTSVYAKHRTYNLMSYGESVLRAENVKNYILLSKDKRIYDGDTLIKFSMFSNNNFMSKILSFHNAQKTISYKNENLNKQRINYGFFQKTDGSGTKYAVDTSVFVSGNSLCLNMTMADNICIGTYINRIESDYKMSSNFIETIVNAIAPNNDNAKKNTYVTGSSQRQAWITDDSSIDNDTSGSTGRIEKLGFYFCHNDNKVAKGYNQEPIYIDSDKIYDMSNDTTEGDTLTTISVFYDKLKRLPLIDDFLTTSISNQIGFVKNIYKDNKEVIDMTIQIEPIADEDIYISPWMMKLSDLFVSESKYRKKITYEKMDLNYLPINCLGAYTNGIKNVTLPSAGGGSSQTTVYTESRPIMMILIDKNDENWSNFKNKDLNSLGFSFMFNKKTKNNPDYYYHDYYTEYVVNVNGINYNDSSLQLSGNISATIRKTNIFNISNTKSTTEENHTFTMVSDNLTSNMSTSSVQFTIPNSMLKNYALRTLGISESKAEHYILFACYAASLGGDFFAEEWLIGPGNSNAPVDSNFNYDTDIGNGVKRIADLGIGKVYDSNDYSIKSVDIEQNLFFCYAKNKNYEFKQYSVYDSLDTLDDDFNILNDNEIEFAVSNSKMIISIKKDIEYRNFIGCFFKTNGKFEFVFGFKPDYEENGGVKYIAKENDIKLSMISSRDTAIYNSDNNFKVGETIRVNGDDAETTVPYYNLSIVFNKIGGAKESDFTYFVKRVDSPYQGALIGNLNNGDKIYYGDMIIVSDNYSYTTQTSPETPTNITVESQIVTSDGTDYGNRNIIIRNTDIHYATVKISMNSDFSSYITQGINPGDSIVLERFSGEPISYNKTYYFKATFVNIIYIKRTYSIKNSGGEDFVNDDLEVNFNMSLLEENLSTSYEHSAVFVTTPNYTPPATAETETYVYINESNMNESHNISYNFDYVKYADNDSPLVLQHSGSTIKMSIRGSYKKYNGGYPESDWTDIIMTNAVPVTSISVNSPTTIWRKTQRVFYTDLDTGESEFKNVTESIVAYRDGNWIKIKATGDGLFIDGQTEYVSYLSETWEK